MLFNILCFRILGNCFRPITALLGIKHVIQGQENLKIDKPFIIVSNHQSILDMLVIYSCLPLLKKCRPIAKRYLLWAGPFGTASWLGGHIFMKQDYSDQTKKDLDKIMDRLEKRKEVLWMIPEGGVYNNGQINKFRKGPFHLAVKSKLPIVPVVSSPLSFLDKNSKKFDDGTMVIKALPPVTTIRLTTENVNDLTETVRKMMINAFDELKRQT